MKGLVYTEEQLQALRESPLVKKPDGLPSISQWMDVPADQTTNTNNTNGTVRRTRGLREGEGGVAVEQRPLINPMGQFGRRQSTRKYGAPSMLPVIDKLSIEPGEETVLGPPKLSFLSARKNTGEAKERTGITSMDGDNLGDRFPRDKNERWTRDRDPERNRDKGYTNGRRGVREEGEGWTNVKGRKSLGQEDFERFGRNGDRNREKGDGDAEDAAPRRGNRDRTEQRWGRRDDTKEDGGKSGVQGGWRERDRDREQRDRDRDWNRGANKAEEDPEWMDTKIEKKEFKPRTQEDFQRWKEQMKAKDTTTDEKEESREPADMPTATAAAAAPMLTQPSQNPSTTEPTQGILFGNWGRDKAAEITSNEPITSKAKPDKKSRFMTMFAKPEEAAAPAHPPTSGPGPVPVMEANADKEGFQRILLMLGQNPASNQPAPPPNAPTPTNGTRHGGGISLDFHQQSPPPEAQSNRPPRTLEQQSILENILAPRPAGPESRPSQQSRFSSMSPDNAMHDQFRLPRPDSSHPEDQFPHQQPPSRNTNVPDANLAAILNSRARDESHRDQATKQRERDFLLTLMQQPTRATPPQMANHNLPRQGQENQNMPFFDQHRQQPQAQPKGRPGVPPGFMEDPRIFNENEMLRREAEARREQELRQQINMQQQQEAIRMKNARMPMGFPGHEDPALGLARRSTADGSRPATNMGIPSQPVPDMGFMGGRQPGMPPTPQERPNIAPPPGFGGGPMRQPPGLNGPNPQQQMGPGGPNFSAGNTPLGHPPGFPPPGNMRGMGFPGGPGGNGMQGPPQGYFPPPGYGPPMPTMRGDDPRLMFEGHQAFGGPGPRQQQGRPGPGMY